MELLEVIHAMDAVIERTSNELLELAKQHPESEYEGRLHAIFTLMLLVRAGTASMPLGIASDLNKMIVNHARVHGGRRIVIIAELGEQMIEEIVAAATEVAPPVASPVVDDSKN